MNRAASILAAILATAATPAPAEDDARSRNALSDIARAQRAQAETMRQLDQRDRDRATRETWDRNNAKRDARSLRRFD